MMNNSFDFREIVENRGSRDFVAKMVEMVQLVNQVVLETKDQPYVIFIFLHGIP